MTKFELRFDGVDDMTATELAGTLTAMQGLLDAVADSHGVARQDLKVIGFRTEPEPEPNLP